MPIQFLPHHEMEIALVALTDDLCRQLTHGRLALLVLLDLKAVFDMVNHNLMAHQLAY